MEASGAGLAAASGGEGTQGAEGQGGPQEQQQGQQEQAQQQLDPQAVQQLNEFMESLSTGQEDMRAQMQDLMAQRGTGGEQEQQPQEPQIDLAQFATETDPAKAAERLQQIINDVAGQRAEQLMKEQLAPVSEQVTTMRQQMEADALIAKHPDLGKPEVAKSVMETAENFAKIVGQPELAGSVAFVELVYKAGRAEELAQQQQAGAAAAPGEATLEGAGGASPGGGQQGDQRANAIKESWGQRTDVLAKL